MSSGTRSLSRSSCEMGTGTCRRSSPCGVLWHRIAPSTRRREITYRAPVAANGGDRPSSTWVDWATNAGARYEACNYRCASIRARTALDSLCRSGGMDAGFAPLCGTELLDRSYGAGAPRRQRTESRGVGRVLAWSLPALPGFCSDDSRFKHVGPAYLATVSFRLLLSDSGLYRAARSRHCHTAGASLSRPNLGRPGLGRFSCPAQRVGAADCSTLVPWLYTMIE